MLNGEEAVGEEAGAPTGNHLSIDAWKPSAMTMRVSSLPSGAVPAGCLMAWSAWLKMSKLYGVARMLEVAIALGIGALQRRPRASVRAEVAHTALLRAHQHEREPLLLEHRGLVVELHGELELAEVADVGPLDDRRAVEARPVGRRPHDHPAAIRRRRKLRGRVGLRSPFEENSLLLVAELPDVVSQAAGCLTLTTRGGRDDRVRDAACAAVGHIACGGPCEHQ